MEIIGKIIGLLICGGILFLYLGAFACLIYMAKVLNDVHKEEKKGISITMMDGKTAHGMADLKNDAMSVVSLIPQTLSFVPLC